LFPTPQLDETRKSTQLKRPLNQRPQALVIGFGSSYGNDQAGWRVIASLARRDHLPARLKSFSEVTELMDELGDSKLLILVDACRGGSKLGAVSRFEWPDPRVRQHCNHSTHGVRLCDTLELADRIGRLPPNVTIFGIDIGDDMRPEMSPEVVQAVNEVESAVIAEICESSNERINVGELTVTTG
jgi:hydrogenase maturation protease